MQKNQPEQIRAIDGLDQVRRDGWMDEDEACGSACTDVQVVYRTGQDQDITLHRGDGSPLSGKLVAVSPVRISAFFNALLKHNGGSVV